MIRRANTIFNKLYCYYYNGKISATVYSKIDSKISFDIDESLYAGIINQIYKD